MPSRKVFNDSDNHELDVFINHRGLLYISVKDPDDNYQWNYICLEREDVTELIESLQDLVDQMPAESLPAIDAEEAAAARLSS